MKRIREALAYVFSFGLLTPLRVVRKNLRAFFATRLLLKLMSLILGILLWYAISATDVATGGRDQFVADVPVRVILRPDSSARFRLDPSSVVVHVFVERAASRLGPEDLRLLIDGEALGGAETGELFPEVILPEGVRLMGPLPKIRVTVVGRGPKPEAGK